MLRNALVLTVLAIAGVAGGAWAQTANKEAPSDAEYIREATSAAPAALAAAARVARVGSDGSLTVIREGTNGITCVIVPPGRYCADAQALQWMQDAIAGHPKPTNTAPGIAFMAKGGVHFENAAGDALPAGGPNTTTHQEPPHWMLMWPLDPQVTGLPTKETAGGGAYIMFAGSPYAHLMVYEDPNRIFTLRHH